MSTITIGKLAKAAQVSVDTIRFYEKCGLLQAARRPSGFREFSQQDLDRLLFVRRARQLGISLEEISHLLALEDVPEGSQLESVLEDQLRAIDNKIAELKLWRSALKEWHRDVQHHAADCSLVQKLSRASLRPPSCSPGCPCSDPSFC